MPSMVAPYTHNDKNILKASLPVRSFPLCSESSSGSTSSWSQRYKTFFYVTDCLKNRLKCLYWVSFFHTYELARNLQIFVIS
jgi:hypothetical protein